jgi:hypothetical protein
MNNLFEPTTAVDIISRLGQLHSKSQPVWGKMSVSQMLAHCQATFDVYFGDKKLKRGLAGLLFGRIAKKQLFSSKPWRQNLPTAPEFIIKDDRNFEGERTRLVDLINRFSTEGPSIAPNIHPFFGKMSKDEWAMLQYRHLDHHLRQFGA